MGLKKKELRTDLDLTPKQKMFVEVYVKDWGTITQAEALKRAGYVCKNENDYSVIASRLLSRRHNPHVAKYFDKRFEKEIKMYEGDNLRRFKRFERLADKAEKKDQYAAAINAEYRSGQLAGAFVDRKEVMFGKIDQMDRLEVEQRVEQLLGNAMAKQLIKQKELEVKGEIIDNDVADDSLGLVEEQEAKKKSKSQNLPKH